MDGLTEKAVISLAAAISVAVASYAAAKAEKDIGCAAVGAMAENKELFVNGLIMTVLPETIVLFGFIIAFLLVGKI